jgi:hypothetical protein
MATQPRHAKPLEDLEVGALLPVPGNPLLEQPAPDPSHLRPPGRVVEQLVNQAGETSDACRDSPSPMKAKWQSVRPITWTR